MLLHETALPPRLYVPEPDLDASAFVPSDHSTHCPFKGDADLPDAAGRRPARCENALWAYPDPVDDAPWLAGYASLYWEAADAWYDEDELVHGLTDPFHRVDVRASSRHVQVLAGDTVLAESRAPLVLSETGLPNRFYLAADGRAGAAGAHRHPHALPVQGRRRLLDGAAAGRHRAHRRGVGLRGAAARVARIAGRVSFAHDGLRVLVDGEPR